MFPVQSAHATQRSNTDRNSLRGIFVRPHEAGFNQAEVEAIERNSARNDVEAAAIEDWRQILAARNAFSDPRRRRSLDGLPSIDLRLAEASGGRPGPGTGSTHAGTTADRPRRHSDAHPLLRDRTSNASLNDGGRRVRFLLEAGGATPEGSPSQRLEGNLELPQRLESNDRPASQRIQNRELWHATMSGLLNNRTEPDVQRIVSGNRSVEEEQGGSDGLTSTSPRFPAHAGSTTTRHQGGVAVLRPEPPTNAHPSTSAVGATAMGVPFPRAEPAPPNAPPSGTSAATDNQVGIAVTNGGAPPNAPAAALRNAPAVTLNAPAVPLNTPLVVPSNPQTPLNAQLVAPNAQSAAPNVPPAEGAPPIDEYIGRYSDVFLMHIPRNAIDAVRNDVGGRGHLEVLEVPGDDKVLVVYAETMRAWDDIFSVAIVAILPRTLLSKLLVLVFLKAPRTFAIIAASLGAFGLWMVQGGDLGFLPTTNVLTIAPRGLGSFCVWIILGCIAKGYISLIGTTIRRTAQGCRAAVIRAVTSQLQVVLEALLGYLDRLRDLETVAGRNAED